MKILNLFRAKERLPESFPAWEVSLAGLTATEAPKRRGQLQAMVTRLVRTGLDACVTPQGVATHSDILILGADGEAIATGMERLSQFQPSIAPIDAVSPGAIEAAWRNRIRNVLGQQRFLPAGDRYIRSEDIANRTNPNKTAFRIQAAVQDGRPAIWVDPRVRIMTGLDESDIEAAETRTEDSNVKVVVLPTWQRGLLIGRLGLSAGDQRFTLGSRTVSTSDYWKIKHDIDFVSPRDEMLDVLLEGIGKPFSYPASCVFKAFEPGSPLDREFKKSPDTRINESVRFLGSYLPTVEFLGSRFTFEGEPPSSTDEVGFQTHQFPLGREFEVSVGDNATAQISRLQHALKEHGAYAGPLDAALVVVHPGVKPVAQAAAQQIIDGYAALKLGNLRVCSDLGDGGYVDTQGQSQMDYVHAIGELRHGAQNCVGLLLALVILPESYTSNVYYQSRDKLFETSSAGAALPCQFMQTSTARTLAGGKSAYYTAVNLAAQMYVKLGGTGYAIWVLDNPADSNIPGIQAGSTCYAYHDVSRRPATKASTTAYSATIDSWGRYIATWSKPMGGEVLTAPVFYDILMDIILKVAQFNRGEDSPSPGDRHCFQRLLFGKDGMIRPHEALMMQEVIEHGVPDQGKEPFGAVLKKLDSLPDQMVVDIISVNKSPNKRIFERNGRYSNVPEGTAISYDANTGLLVSSQARFGSSQPIEISLKAHSLINVDGVSRPHIGQLMDEYYRLTFLDWASVFMQGKYALPQILTQNLGENLSAGVSVPQDMILI